MFLFQEAWDGRVGIGDEGFRVVGGGGVGVVSVDQWGDTGAAGVAGGSCRAAGAACEAEPGVG